MSPSDAPVLPLMLMMGGAYLAWFGVKYWEDTHTIWPSDPVKNVLTGGTLPARTQDESAAGLLASEESTISSEAVSAAGSPQAANQGSGSAAVPSGAGSAANDAKSLFTHHNWSLSMFPALVSLWNQESGWSPKARNSSSGAFGIAQALGHGVPGGAAPDGTNEYGGFGLSPSQAQAANSGVAYWQIVWGLNYIAATYGNPQAAWAHEQSHNWY